MLTVTRTRVGLDDNSSSLPTEIVILFCSILFYSNLFYFHYILSALSSDERPETQNNTTQLFLIPLTSLRSKIEDLYGNSGIHHRKFIVWVSLFRWLGVRYQLFACLLLSGADGQAAPGRATTSLYNLLLPGVPQVHKQQVVKKPVKKPVIIISYSRSEPSPCLTFTSCSALQGKSSRVCPNRPRASPLMAISRLFLEWDDTQHGAGGQTQTVPICMEARVVLPVRHLLTQPVCWQGGKQRWCPQDHVGELNCPDSNTWIVRDVGLRHLTKQDILSKVQQILDNFWHREPWLEGGWAEKVSPQLSLTFNLTQTHECPSHSLKASLFQCI